MNSIKVHMHIYFNDYIGDKLIECSPSNSNMAAIADVVQLGSPY